jgi:hypothetical protein
MSPPIHRVRVSAGRQWAIIAAIFTLVSIACTPAEPGDVRPEGNSAFPPLHLDQEALTSALKVASAGEAELLMDGILTFSDYERAVYAAMACIEEKGWRIVHHPNNVYAGSYIRYDFSESVIGPRLTKRGLIEYTGERSDSLPDGTLQFQACKDNNSTTVEVLWMAHVAPTQSELEEIRSAIAVCLNEAGHEVSLNPSEDELLRLGFPPDGVQSGAPPRWFLDCQARAYQEWDG